MPPEFTDEQLMGFTDAQAVILDDRQQNRRLELLDRQKLESLRKEVKHVHLPSHIPIVAGDIQDLETMERLESEPKVKVFYASNKETDYLHPNPDGSITRIAKIITINGCQTRIPADVPFEIPLQIYKNLMQSEEDARRITVLPDTYPCIGETPKRR